VRRALQPLIDRNLVVVRHQQDWLEIEIRTDILFPSGVAQLSTSADAVLQKLASILAPFPNPLRVEGFTDNVPISTPQYPSNWELSAGRAASVARLFALSGVAPDRLGIIGWGEVRPLAENTTIEGRNQNRRVVVVVMNAAREAPRQLSDAAAVGQLARADTPPPLVDPAPAVPLVRAPSAAASADKVSGSPASAPAAAAEIRHPGSATPTADGLAESARRRVSPDR
jgi:chemotaxis protein MotB